MQKAICFFGRSGAGKGTVSAILSELIGWPILSTGELVRAEAKKATNLGSICRLSLTGGTFLSAESVIALEKPAIRALGGARGIIFEGSPRSAGEAKFLADEFDAVFIWLDVPEEVCMGRLIGRNRLHDTPKNIFKRFGEFEEVYPGIAQEVGLYHIDGTPPADEVARGIEELFRHWIFSQNLPKAEFQDFAPVPPS